jgi:hypothetical protein
VRLRVDGEIVQTEDVQSLDKRRKHTVEAVVDRVVVKKGVTSRVTESVETALKIGEGMLIAWTEDGGDRVYSLLREDGVRGLRPLLPGAHAAELLVQQPPGHVRRVQRPGLSGRDRSGSGRTGRLALPRRGRGQILGSECLGEDGLVPRLPRPDRGQARHRRGPPLETVAEAAAGAAALRHRRAALPRRLEGQGGQGSLRHGVGGRRPEARAPLSRNRLRQRQALVRTVHQRRHLQALRRLPPAAGERGGAHRRTQHRRGLGAHRGRGAGVRRGPAPVGCGAPDCDGGAQGDPRTSRLPVGRGARLPVPRPGGSHAVGRRGPAHPAGESGGLRAHRCHLHPRRALDRARSSSSSTTRRPSAARIT